MTETPYIDQQTLELFREQLTRFCEQEISPIAERIDSENKFPSKLWKKLGDIGALGITAPTVFGGSAMPISAQVMAMEIISQFSGAVGLSFGAHANLCVNQLVRFANKDQSKKYLPRLISGEWVGALAMSENQAGSDVMSMKLVAEASGDGYRLNGSKMWITNGPDANVVIVYAKTGEKSKDITAFIVERGMKGFSTGPKLDKLGMRGSNTSELFFEDCLVPKENIFGKFNCGVHIMMSGLDIERVVLAAGPVGIMQACLNLTLAYVREREQFGQPIGQFQLVQAKLADIYTRLESSRAYLYSRARDCDSQTITREDAVSVILFTSENATQTALDTIQCLGGNGYMNEFPAGRYLRDAKLYEIGAGTCEIRRMLIGRELFSTSL